MTGAAALANTVCVDGGQAITAQAKTRSAPFNFTWPCPVMERAFARVRHETAHRAFLSWACHVHWMPGGFASSQPRGSLRPKGDIFGQTGG
jgi:hypothetical protein